MVDDVKDITEKAESKEALDRARLARERREAEQRKRLDELRAHAAAAQAQREKRDEDRRRRMAEARSKDEDRRTQVEERKRAIWEASISRREALLQRERDRTERLERARAARSSPRPAFAFGSSTPRLLEPVDSAGFFWAARSTNPIDQMNFFESLAASTTNVMFASAPLTRRVSALHLDTSDTDNKDEPVSPQPLWSSVARRRTDLVPTLPARPGRAYSMTRLDRINAPTHHSRSQTRSGDTTPSRPGSAMSNTTGVVRRASSAPRKPRPASIAGTGVNTPRGSETGANSVATTPSVSRDATVVSRAPSARRPRPLSLHAPARNVPAAPVAPGEGKPPLHRKPKPSKEHEKNRKSMSVSPGRALSPSRSPAKEHVEKEMSKSMIQDKSVVNALEVTQKLEALRIDTQPSENKSVEIKQVTNIEQNVEQKEKIDVQKPVKVIEEREEKKDKKEEREERKEKREDRKEPSQEKTEDNDMTASMISRRITTEEEAKAALAERRRRAREELERQAEAERKRLQLEAEEEAERSRQEEERQRREEAEARELAALQRSIEEEKLRKAIEAQQQLEREEALRRVREEEERAARVREEEERRRAAETAEAARRGEAEREERERLARKQRVEAIMARTRLKKQAEEDKKQQEIKAQQNQSANGEAGNPNIQEGVPDSNATQENIVNTNVTGDSVVNASITQESVPSANTTEEIVANITESATIPNESASSAIIPNTNASENSTVENTTEIVNLVNIESEVKVENAQSAESVGNVANIDNSNGNVEKGELLNLATSRVDSQSAPPTNNGNVSDLLGLSTQLETVDKPEEQTPTKQIDNTPILDTNNGNANVGHISANFIQTERMVEVTNKLADDFATHNGHGHNHPLTLQNAI